MARWLGQAHTSDTCAAWLALDAGDAVLDQFLRNLLTAVGHALPGTGAEALDLLAASGAVPTEVILDSLINDLDIMAGPMVIAMDDYHLVDGSAVHEAVTYLLDNLPPQVSVAIATRADPPLPLSRLRARGELIEVRVADLKFTANEAAEFLNGAPPFSVGLTNPAGLADGADADRLMDR